MTVRIPNATFTGCSVPHLGTLGPSDIQVGGPFDGYYRVLIQAQPVEFDAPYPGQHTPVGETVAWTPGEPQDWPIEMTVRVVDRSGDFPDTTVDHGADGVELIPTWPLALQTVQGLNLEWNPNRSAINVNDGTGEMQRYSASGELLGMGGANIWLNPDSVHSSHGLVHVPDAPNPIYVPGGPFTAFPGAVSGFGYDRYGVLREEFNVGFDVIDVSGGLTGPDPGNVGDVFFLPNDPDAGQTYVFSVQRYSLTSVFNAPLRKYDAYPTEYVVNLPAAAGADGTTPQHAPKYDDMTQWTSLGAAARTRAHGKLFNTLAVWQGDRVAQLTEVGSSPNSSIDGGVTFDAVEGETYMIQLGTGDPGVNGAAVLTWKPTP